MVKQLPVEADMPEFVARRGLEPMAMELDCMAGDLILIAF
jgi:hypothetical protein